MAPAIGSLHQSQTAVEYIGVALVSDERYTILEGPAVFLVVRGRVPIFKYKLLVLIKYILFTASKYVIENGSYEWHIQITK